MRILFAVHRFGKNLIGGAERHLWNLAEQMAAMGCEVDVATTLSSDFYPFLRFGLVWHGREANAIQDLPVAGATRPIRIIRFPVRSLPKPVGAILQKHLQRRWESEELAMETDSLAPLPSHQSRPIPLTGWHLPELMSGKIARWTMGRASLWLPQTRSATLHIQGLAPRRQTIQFSTTSGSRAAARVKGHFDLAVPLVAGPPETGLFEIHPVIKPLRDSRVLGVLVTQISLSDEGGIVSAPMNLDHRALRAQDKSAFIQAYQTRAASRPARYGWIFDALRGPHCPGLERFLMEKGPSYDWVIAGILPFSVIPSAVRASREKGFRCALLPLFHVDDDFYYWRHYLDAIRAADINLANSHFSNKVFFPALGARSITAGAGVDEALYRRGDISGARFRKRYGFAAEEKLVLSVGRKCGPKRYRMLIDAVDNIQSRMACRLVLIGPEDDNLPITSPHCSYLGKVSDNDLIDAYDACDVFCLMSESESFGMVFLEAWMRGKPAIGNRNCGPVADLIGEGERGLLASSGAELETQLIALLSDPQWCTRLGAEGMRYAEANFTWKVIARRILDHFDAALAQRPGDLPT